MMEHILNELMMHMQTYPLIGIAEIIAKITRKKIATFYREVPNGFVRGLKAKRFLGPISNPEFAKEFISRVDGFISGWTRRFSIIMAKNHILLWHVLILLVKF